MTSNNSHAHIESHCVNRRTRIPGSTMAAMARKSNGKNLYIQQRVIGGRIQRMQEMLECVSATMTAATAGVNDDLPNRRVRTQLKIGTKMKVKKAKSKICTQNKRQL